MEKKPADNGYPEYDLLPVGALVIDADLNILGWNRTLEKWTGVSRGEALGVGLPQLFQVLSQGIYERRLRELFETGLPVYFSASLHKHFLPIPPRHGLMVPWMIQRTEARLLPGRRDRAIVTILDVTVQHYHLAQLKREREELVATQESMKVANRRLEEANEQLTTTQETLRESRRYTEGILRSMADMLVVFDPAGRITRVNDATLRRLGCNAEQLLNHPVELVFSQPPIPLVAAPEEYEFVQRLTSLLDQRGRVSELEGWRHDPCGVPQPISLSGATMRSADGELLGYVCVLQDTAERKRIQEELHRGKRLEAMGRLAAGIAHEINSPLQCISGCIEYLDQQLPSLNAALEAISLQTHGAEQAKLEAARENVPETLQDARTAVNRVNEIVSAMRSMVYQGRNEFAPVDLNALINDAVVITRSQWKQVAEMRLELDPQLPLPAGITAELSQVVLNLLVNAGDALDEKYGESGDLGAITVRTRSEGDSVVVEVEDNGPGVPPGISDRIFEPFFTSKELGKGTGQGLAFSYQAVERHNGSIELDESYTAGARFRVTLPVTQPCEADSRPRQQEAVAVG